MYAYLRFAFLTSFVSVSSFTGTRGFLGEDFLGIWLEVLDFESLDKLLGILSSFLSSFFSVFVASSFLAVLILVFDLEVLVFNVARKVKRKSKNMSS